MKLPLEIFCLICLLSINQILAANCDSDHQCPVGLVCRFISYLPGTKACVYRGAISTPTSKREGRCPTTGLMQWLNPLATSCNSNEDCPINRKCCPLSYGNLAHCVPPLPINTQPTVTPIVTGEVKYLSDGLVYIGASTLVQSNNFNYIIDTSAPRMTEELLQNLWSKAGLTAEDIDMVVTTHGHPDHYASLQMFSNIQQIFSGFQSNGQIFKFDPLAKKETFLLNNDNNVEVISTPGHTPQDISVIVRNVPGFGTVSIVGDLILNKDNPDDSSAYDKTVLVENRQKVACMSDYIVPGHGAMFQMTADEKSKFSC